MWPSTHNATWLIKQLDTGEFRQGDLLPDVNDTCFNEHGEDGGVTYGRSVYCVWNHNTVLILYWTRTKSESPRVHTAYLALDSPGMGERLFFCDKDRMETHMALLKKDWEAYDESMKKKPKERTSKGEE